MSANYGQSKTISPSVPLIGGPATPLTDANELDIVFIWKARKNLMLKLFHANRTSEYDGTNGKEFTHAHTRLIGVYKF